MPLGVDSSLVTVMPFHFQHIDLHHFVINVIDYTVMGCDMARPCYVSATL